MDATVGGASSESYNTLDGIDVLLAGRAGDKSAWDDLGTEEKEAVAITATNRLEQEEYEGYKVTTTQALQFPRSYLSDPKTPRYPVYFAIDAIPKPVLLAHAELCLQIANDPTLFDDTGLEPFSSLSRGDTSLTMRGVASGKLPAQVSRFLRGIRTGSENVIRVQRA